jgi:hypothetical protein
MGRRGAIIAYQLAELSPSRRPRFSEKVLGQDRKVGDRTYRRRGLLDEIPHWKVGRGVVVVSAQDRARVVKELRRWTRDVEWWEVDLTPRQERRLRPGTSG